MVEYFHQNTRRRSVFTNLKFDSVLLWAKFLQSVAYQLLIYIVLDSRPLSLYKNVRYEEVEDVKGWFLKI